MPPTTSSAPRFHVDAPLSPGAMLELPPHVERHVTALRLPPGADITLFNGEGGEYGARLERIGRAGTWAKVGAFRDAGRESPLSITLVLGVSAGDRMDVAIQKSTELGVTAIQPVSVERSIVRLSDERAERRLAHWQAVAAAACEQCGRNRVPEVRRLMPLNDFLDAPPPGARLMLSPQGERGLRELQRDEAVTLLVGPEGGFAPYERERAIRQGFEAVRFGPRVLRTETAPLAVIAALQALWGDC